MLYSPFRALADYLSSYDIATLNDYDYAHAPYPLLLNKLNPASKNRKELKNQLKQFIRPNVEMDNIQEAMDNVYYIYTVNKYPDVLALFEQADKMETQDSPEWQVLRGIKQFYEKNNRLPVSVDIPDLKATTEGYLKFKKVYLDQFEADCLEVYHNCNGESELVKEICKNIRDLK